MQPTLFGERFGISESQQRLSEYVAKLFAEGELMDVIEIAQKELETKPANLDLVIYRACAILILQVSGTVRRNQALVEQAIQHLDAISDLLHKTETEYDESLDFYAALGYLVLEKFDKADQLLAFIAPIIESEEESMAYYNDRKAYWTAKRTVFPQAFQMHHHFLLS